MNRRTWRIAIVNGSLLLFAMAALFPLAWMVSVSLMTPGEASAVPAPLTPSRPTFDNYATLFETEGLGRYVVNSLVLAVSATLLSLVVNVSAGYAFAKLDFRGRRTLFRVLLAALLVPAQVAMIPLFLMLKEMGLANTYLGVLIPSIANIFGIFLVRQYALSIPTEMLETARMEGAGEFRIFLSIVLPSLRPIIATLCIFTFLASWNDFLWPLIVLIDQEMYTLPVALASMSRENVQDVELMMAGAVVTVLPVLLLFLALQRYYVQALTLTGTKR